MAMSTVRKVSTVLFDLNETLVHQSRSEFSHIACTYSELCKCGNWNVLYEQFRDAWYSVHERFRERVKQGIDKLEAGGIDSSRAMLSEPYYREFIAEMMEMCGVRPILQRHVECVTWAYQQSWCEGYVAIDDAVSSLRRLRSSLNVGLVTNFHQGNIVPDILKLYGLDEFLQVTVISSLENVRKPHPHLFHLALERLSIPISRADSVVYVGDNPIDDVLGAKLCGMTPILLNGSASGAITAHSLSEACDIIERINRS